MGPRSQYGNFGDKRNVVFLSGIELLIFGIPGPATDYKNREFFFSRAMEADRNVNVVGGDVAVL